MAKTDSSGQGENSRNSTSGRKYSIQCPEWVQVKDGQLLGISSYSRIWQQGVRGAKCRESPHFNAIKYSQDLPKTNFGPEIWRMLNLPPVNQQCQPLLWRKIWGMILLDGTQIGKNWWSLRGTEKNSPVFHPPLQTSISEDFKFSDIPKVI